MVIKYPTENKIIEYNKFILQEIKVRKADQPKVLSREKLKEAINECKKKKGELYDKAASLLKSLIQKHPFASGNRRTAIASVEMFLEDNKLKLRIKNTKEQAEVLQGVRENFYTHKEIKDWLKNGKIREFKRFR